MARVRPDQAQVAEVAGGGECREAGLTYERVEKSAPSLRSTALSLSSQLGMGLLSVEHKMFQMCDITGRAGALPFSQEVTECMIDVCDVGQVIQ